MKTLLVIVLACLSLIVAQANAQWSSITINLDALELRSGPTGDSPLLPEDSLVLFVVDTARNGVTTNALTLGTTLTLGSYINDDFIAARFDCSVAGEDGYVSASMRFAIDGSNPIRAGYPVGIMWFPGLTLADNTFRTPTYDKYGSYTGGATPQFGDPWVVPPDGCVVSLVLSTPDGDPASAGYAIYPVPEPATVTLLGLGLLGVLGIVRRAANVGQ